MQLTCPHCDFSKAIDPAKAPPRPVKVNCPKCSQSFRFDGATQSQPPDPPSVSNDEQTVAPAQIICPVCGLNQPQGVSCSGCGVVYAKLPPQQGRAGFAQQPGESVTSALRAELRDPDPQQQPKAGFWVRFVACLLDSVLVGVVQLVLSLLFWAIIGMTGLASAEDPAINMVVSLFGIVLNLVYAVFFTGYCGQTPGKMALRIKVIRTDGSDIGYGRAALREIPGKFVSTILLGIGYLMVAFDKQKQGLHDKIADTYVIKL